MKKEETATIEQQSVCPSTNQQTNQWKVIMKKCAQMQTLALATVLDKRVSNHPE